MSMPAEMRRALIARAGNRCEYCGLAQAGQEATFHVDHIIPLTSGGPTELDNLGLACVSCSLRKGARTIAPDPESGLAVPLFHPRMDHWDDHFHWIGVRLLGRTAKGRATVHALRLNRDLILAIRAEEAFHGRHPPG